MKYKLDISKLDTQVVEVMQYEHNVTSVDAKFTQDDIHEDLKELTPCILLSMGDKITSKNGLSYIITDDEAGITWYISENYTQKAGTFFAQFAFIAADGTVKSYQKSFILRVLPSVEWQKAGFEYKPDFLETFRNEITEEIESRVPTKVSELENDAAYLSTDGVLSEYAKMTDIDKALTSYTTTSDVNSLIENRETLRKPKAICNGYFPTNAATTLSSNITFAPDSESVYSKAALMNKKSDGSVFSLDTFTLTVSTASAVSSVNADAVFAINAADISGAGTVFFTAEDLLVKGENTVAYICFEKVNNVCRVTYSRFNSSSATVPAKTSSSFVAISNPYSISNVKMTLEPNSSQEVTSNFSSIVKLTLSGVDKL